MKRSRHIWIAFGFCLAVVLAAMGWISHKAIHLEASKAEARRQKDEALHQKDQALVQLNAALGEKQEALRQKDKALRKLAQAQRQAARDENVRLALWRMDSQLAPLVAQESARPYFAYRALFPLDRGFARMFNDRIEGKDNNLVWSPLLGEPTEHVRVYFQFEPDGTLTSPQVPSRGNADLAVPKRISQETYDRSNARLAEVGKLLHRDWLLAMLPKSTPNDESLVFSPVSEPNRYRQMQRINESQRISRAATERVAREDAIEQNTNFAVQYQGQNVANSINNPFNNGMFLSQTDFNGVVMTPLWIDGNLILARRVTVSGKEYVQGCVLDWPSIRDWLTSVLIRDLLPEARLEPVAEQPAQEDPLVLAAIPVRLVPGDALPGWPPPGEQDLPELDEPGTQLWANADEPATDDENAVVPVAGEVAALPQAAVSSDADSNGLVSPIRLSLSVAWTCVLLAAVAVALLLLGVMRLSERRAAFVSAVTHELRTPLTTFQMYAEMLGEGMVPPPQQREYLATLQTEASRLTHLVENVLSYARLERGRNGGRMEDLGVGRLIEPIGRRLADRAHRAGMELVVEGGDAALESVVRANPSAVEQILFNLVDNACKYAAGAEDKRIHLELVRHDGVVQFQVRDHGPGVSPNAARHLFHSFSKSAHDAANSAPGVGLGLALSRRLAEDMGGRLKLDHDAADGARFVLTLRAADAIRGA